MPSAVAHAAPALALVPAFARRGVPRRLWWLGVLGAMAPDLDVIGLALGAPYGHALDTEAELRALPLPAFAHCEVTELPLFTGGELARGDPVRALYEARRLLSAER